MQLEHIEAVVRPRNPWEAIDLGFSLVRHWWYPLGIIWLSLVIPLILIIYSLLYTHFIWAIILVWWLKPLYDRIVLYFLSRALFGARPGVVQLLKALPQILTQTRLIAALFWERLHFTRAFKLPIWQLEGLNRQAGQHRLVQLRTHSAHQAQLLTWVCLSFEWLIQMTLIGLMYLMLPSYYEGIEWLLEQQPIPLKLLWIAIHLSALTLVEPLYVAGGFSLYLNRRIHLEGWDIELVFRQIAKRLSPQ
ncbi:MAG: hypothetical protein SVR94_11935 [Pseudomonadota bacterium]|nr:hypothetical protein [Pseudomonadota bacterium]